MNRKYVKAMIMTIKINTIINPEIAKIKSSRSTNLAVCEKTISMPITAQARARVVAMAADTSIGTTAEATVDTNFDLFM